MGPQVRPTFPGIQQLTQTIKSSKMRNLLLVGFAAIAAPGAFARLYTIANGCPQAITLYINGESQGKLAVGATTTRTFNKNWSGFIYTDVNGGSQTGTRTTRAGFYGEVRLLREFIFASCLNALNTE